jgi:hypothetical protein
MAVAPVEASESRILSIVSAALSRTEYRGAAKACPVNKALFAAAYSTNV